MPSSAAGFHRRIPNPEEIARPRHVFFAALRDALIFSRRGSEWRTPLKRDAVLLGFKLGEVQRWNHLQVIQAFEIPVLGAVGDDGCCLRSLESQAAFEFNRG